MCADDSVSLSLLSTFIFLSAAMAPRGRPSDTFVFHTSGGGSTLLPEIHPLQSQRIGPPSERNAYTPCSTDGKQARSDTSNSPILSEMSGHEKLYWKQVVETTRARWQQDGYNPFQESALAWADADVAPYTTPRTNVTARSDTIYTSGTIYTSDASDMVISDSMRLAHRVPSTVPEIAVDSGLEEPIFNVPVPPPTYQEALSPGMRRSISLITIMQQLSPETPAPGDQRLTQGLGTSPEVRHGPSQQHTLLPFDYRSESAQSPEMGHGPSQQDKSTLSPFDYRSESAHSSSEFDDAASSAAPSLAPLAFEPVAIKTVGIPKAPNPPPAYTDILQQGWR